MTDYSELIARLRNADYTLRIDAREAADAIEAQAKRIAELESAMKPFEEELKNQELEVPHIIDGDSLIHNYGMRLRDFRNARKVLGEKK